MSTAKDFRGIALGMKGASEGAHMGHPDFRVDGRIFATLHADGEHGMVKLTLEHQQDFVQENPGAFVPESGAWGRRGCTRVRLNEVDEDTLGRAVTLAWRNIANSIEAARGKARQPRPVRPRPKR